MHLAAASVPLATVPWVSNLRAALINLISLMVPLAVIARWRWWHRAALVLRRPDRSWLLLVPLLGMSLGYAYGGPTGSLGVLATSAVLFLALGVNEEVMFRGLRQGVLAPVPLRARCLLVGVLFGVQHTADLLFGQSLFDTAAQVLSGTSSGFVYAAARARVHTIWPLAVLHGLGNFCNTHAQQPFSPALHLTYVSLDVLHGLWLLRPPIEGRRGSRPD